MEMMQLPVNLVQALVNYLVKQPWDQANPFLAEIQKYAPKKMEQPSEEPKNELPQQGA